MNVPGHTTKAPPVGFELRLATNGIQLYAIANLDKTSQVLDGMVLDGMYRGL